MNSFSDDHLDRLRRNLSDTRTKSGKYLLGEVIGQGGMATVYEAEDIDLGRKVALKALKNGDSSHELARRMRREARIVARLEHASIVPIHDVGTLPDGRAYYTMKLVQGKTLAEVVAEHHPLRELLDMFLRVCEAIAFAHSRNVIHRDLKPTNIMIGEFGQILVMDWGIAKAITEPSNRQTTLDPGAAVSSLHAESPASPGDADATVEGTVLGTPAFMAPEQARGELDRVGRHSDIYSLGAILYFILTGEPPFDGDAREVIALVREGAIVSPRTVNQKAPRPLAAICLKAMAAAPAVRYAGAEQLADDIRRYLNREPVKAYHENALERIGRFAAGNKLIVAMVAVYALSRIIIYLVSRL
jgi:serine/threonine protein kinase